MHGINETDVLAATGDKYQQWHGLGVRLPEGMTAVGGFPHVGLGWSTEMRPLMTTDNQGRTMPVKGYRAHVRCDTDGMLGIVSDQYKPVQNMELAELLDVLAGQDAASTLESAGSFFDGRRVFGCIRLPGVIRVGADITEPYVVASTGHGGFAGTNLYPTTVRPVCANTLRASEADVGKGVSFRHTGDMAPKMQQARVALNLAAQEMKRFQESATRLGQMVFPNKHAMRSALGQAYDAAFGRLPERDASELFAKLSAKRAETIQVWEDLLDHPTNQVQGIIGTGWAALQAVTYWNDHVRSPRIGESQRGHSNLFGASNIAKQRSFRALLELTK